MNWQDPGRAIYRVEVSGWDLSENFFVEKTSLNWSEEGGKKVFLNSALREGSIVFIRLMQQFTAGNTFPVAYQITEMILPNGNGSFQYSLMKLRPRSEHEVPEPVSAGCSLEN